MAATTHSPTAPLPPSLSLLGLHLPFTVMYHACIDAGAAEVSEHAHRGNPMNDVHISVHPCLSSYWHCLYHQSRDLNIKQMVCFICLDFIYCCPGRNCNIRLCMNVNASFFPAAAPLSYHDDQARSARDKGETCVS